MDTRKIICLALIIGFELIVCAGGLTPAQEKEKPTLKDFGASLKRIKWDAEKKAAVEIKSKKNSKTHAEEIDVVKVETSLVSSEVLVLNARGNPVVDLTDKDFVVTEDGLPQKVGIFSLGDNAKVPRSIVLIIDWSCSQLPFLRASVVAAKTMIDKLPATDRMAIVTDDIEVLSDFTSDKRKLKERLDLLLLRTSLSPADADFVLDRFQHGQPPFGRGFQYSALMAVLKEAFSAEDQRPVIIFQTDGLEARILQNPIVDLSIAPGLPPEIRALAEAGLKHNQNYVRRNPRAFSLNDVYQAAEKSGATIYSVVPGLRFIGLRPEERPAQMRAFLTRDMAGLEFAEARKRVATYLKSVPDETLSWDADNFAKLQSALAILSTISGGWIDFFAQPSQADEIYSRIFSDINRRYVIGYYPTNKYHDGKRRKVSVTIRDHAEYTVMYRKWYFAPEADR